MADRPGAVVELHASYRCSLATASGMEDDPARMLDVGWPFESRNTSNTARLFDKLPVPPIVSRDWVKLDPVRPHGDRRLLPAFGTTIPAQRLGGPDTVCV